MAGATAQSVGYAAWGAISTPYRLFAESIPEFFHTGQERLKGKGLGCIVHRRELNGRCNGYLRVSPTEVVAAALSNGTFSGLGQVHQVGALGKIGYNAGGAMNQYRATQMMEGNEIKEDEFGLNAVVGLATGHWGQTKSSKLDAILQNLRITIGQYTWGDFLLQEQIPHHIKPVVKSY